MEITIKIPDAIYQQGDVVRMGPHGLILHIYSVVVSGKWDYCNGDLDAWVTRSVYYNCTVQSGRGPEGGFIRPGTCTGFSQNDCLSPGCNESRVDVELIEWDKSIIEPDSMDNLGERYSRWEAVEATNLDEESVDQFENWARHPDREQRDRDD